MSLLAADASWPLTQPLCTYEPFLLPNKLFHHLFTPPCESTSSLSCSLNTLSFFMPCVFITSLISSPFPIFFPHSLFPPRTKDWREGGKIMEWGAGGGGSSGLTEGVPSAVSSLEDGRRIGGRNTLVGIHRARFLCLSLPRTYCCLAGLIPTLTHRSPSLPPCLPSAALLKVLLSLITTIYNTQQLLNGFTFYHLREQWGRIFLLHVASVEIEP